MVDLLLLTLLFYFIQLPLPIIVGRINGVPGSYYTSSRDDIIKLPVLSSRLIRAHNNFKESLFIFIPLSLLSIITNIDVVTAATLWLAARITYVFLYSIGANKMRTFFWIVSIICLIDMGIRLFKHAL